MLKAAYEFFYVPVVMFVIIFLASLMISSPIALLFYLTQ